MSELPPPTPLQNEVLNFILQHIQDHGRSPSMRHIAHELGKGAHSIIARAIEILVRDGHLTKHGKGRNLYYRVTPSKEQERWDNLTVWIDVDQKGTFQSATSNHPAIKIITRRSSK